MTKGQAIGITREMMDYHSELGSPHETPTGRSESLGIAKACQFAIDLIEEIEEPTNPLPHEQEEPMPIQCNPVFDGKYYRKDVTVELADDLSKIKIQQGDSVIDVDGSFVADLYFVLNDVVNRTTDEKLQDDRQFNTQITSCSWPADDEFFDGIREMQQRIEKGDSE